MTEHVRTSYRNHRRAAWALALGLAVAAFVAIPIATGASDKTFTLTVSPNPVCSSTTNGAAQTTLTLRNTARSASLGSAEVYFPPNTVHSVSSPASLRPNETGTTSGGAKDIVAFGNLNLAPRGGFVSVTVRFKAGTFTGVVTAVVKQSNQFNDAQGGANLFELDPFGVFPTMRLVACVTVEGQVFQDRNLDNGYTTGNGAFDDSDIPKDWTVKLYQKDVGAASYPSTPFQTVRSSGPVSGTFNGTYTFTQVPTGSDYKICVTARAPDDGSKWGLQAPTGNTQCGPISTGGPTSSAAQLLPNLSANASGKDFQVVPVVGPFGANTAPSTVGGYTVDAGSNSTKADEFYVQDVWVDSEGRTNFRFSPILPCTSNCSQKIYLLETLTADIALDDLSGNQAELLYDDLPPFLDGDLMPMPYCDSDPRQSGGNLATSGVLPGTHTSCIVTGEQAVVAGGDVHVVYRVYTAYDGGRQVG